MTNHWIDIQNADVIMINGCNPAENHPIAWHWVRTALDRGAKLIVADPRFTRSASQAHLYAHIRPGTNIVFYGGLINYILENERFDREYVLNYTNASTLINPEFRFTNGLFSGYDPAKRAYANATWQYQAGSDGTPRRDETLQDPQTVFQLMKRHYSRYDAQTVARATGIPAEKFLQIAELFSSTGRPDRAGTILYAMGQTQATVGTQNIRSLAVIQLLLGNIGIAGGGVNALRGEANVQGATDMGVLWEWLPGYLNVPRQALHPTLKDYLEKETPKTGYWANKPNFMVSLLKAWWGDAATPENEFGYGWLPKAKGNYSHLELFDAMHNGTIKGFFVVGENPAVGMPNSNKVRMAMENLDWLVVADEWMTETAEFWTSKRPLLDVSQTADPAKIKTEVFFFPAASFNEKAGSYTNSGRWLQWNEQAVEPEGDARSDLYLITRLLKAIQKEYAGSTAAKDQGLLKVNWEYGDPPSFTAVLREVNGYETASGKQVAGFAALKADGSTACGNWIYSGVFPDPQTNRAASRKRDDPSGLGLYPGWSFAWPANRRILYNRASADLNGNPRNPARKLVWWDPQGGAEKRGAWVGNDVPDFAAPKAPDAAAKAGGAALDALSGTDPFIMKTDGRGWLFVPSGLVDGPLPEHYEPFDAPTANLLNAVALNPAVKIFDGPMDKKGTPDEFPVIATTFRLAEHYQGGSETRSRRWLVELMPEMFVEVNPAFAERRGIRDGEKVRVESARGTVLARAVLTERMQPLEIDGRQVDMVALPWHWGYSGYSTGHSANVLTPTIGDANTYIQEDKAFLVRVTKA